MRKSWARTAVRACAVAAGFLLFTGGAAQAADVTSRNDQGVTGLHLLQPVRSVADVCGGRLGLGGTATTDCGDSAAVQGDGAIADMYSADNRGVLTGDQAQIVVQAPVNLCGLAVTVDGTADSRCTGSAVAALGGGAAETDGTRPVMTTTGNDGILSGNQVLAPVQIPINVCGLAVSVGGHAHASCDADATASTARSTGGMTTADNTGIADGNQVQAPVQIPINVCGNAVALAGDAYGSCSGSDAADLLGGEGTRLASSVNRVLGGGNELDLPVQVPVTFSGNGVTGPGVASAASAGGAAAAM